MRELLAYSQGVFVEEKLTLRIKADNNGNIYLPTAGYSSNGTQDCEYFWKVSIDGLQEVEYIGVGSSDGKIRVGYGLNPLSVHTVIVKPKEEKYGWLRAFGYKGTDIANSLINIISDKSYKGFAISEIFSGDYFKAYQYYGCENLINTDEELLPDTLQIIGDNYRYYEYAGCKSLVSNAEERILKTVKVIGDNYRAYQYQNCIGINKINMRAINWASVGTNYRYNQYSGIGTDRNLVNIYIEGGIEEGGNWGLNDSNVKGVYVYKDLVNDYKTKLSGITSSKIQKNSLWDNLEYEFIEYIGIADSTGKIRIPVGGYSTSGNQDCAYDWMVSIDGGEEEEITGTGSATYVSVGSGLIEGSEHRIIIKPKTIGWGWGRAFGFYNTGAESYIKELIHDSYKCYASNRIETGDYYKYSTYRGCDNLINSYEKLPTSVTTIGNYYMKQCYMGDSSLESAFWEVIHKGCSLGVDYRYEEYENCSSMGIHQGIAGYNGAYPTNYRYNYLSGVDNDIKVYITRYEKLGSGLDDSMGLGNGAEVYCFINDIIEYVKSDYWTNIDDIDFKPRYYNYEVYVHPDVNGFNVVENVSLPASSYVSSKFETVGGGGDVAIGFANQDTASYYNAVLLKYKLNNLWDTSNIGNLLGVNIETHTNNGSANFRNVFARGENIYAVETHGGSESYDEIYIIWYKNGVKKGYVKPKYETGGYAYGGGFGGGFSFSNNGQFVSAGVDTYYMGDRPTQYWRHMYKLSKARDLTTATLLYKQQDLFPGCVLTFSDDGYTMYSSSSTGTKQYTLTIPFDIRTAVDSGKTNSNQITNWSRDGNIGYGENKQYKLI